MVRDRHVTLKRRDPEPRHPHLMALTEAGEGLPLKCITFQSNVGAPWDMNLEYNVSVAEHPSALSTRSLPPASNFMHKIISKYIDPYQRFRLSQKEV